MTLSVWDVIGLIGVLILLITYFLLQVGRLKLEHYSYSFLNLLGAALIFVSLLFDWNLAAGLIELFWIVISLLGIFRIRKKSEARKNDTVNIMRNH